MKFEAYQWYSECGDFCIMCTPYQKPYQASDERKGTHGDRVKHFQTFSAAVAWCESRAKQQQGQGGESNV